MDENIVSSLILLKGFFSDWMLFFLLFFYFFIIISINANLECAVLNGLTFVIQSHVKLLKVEVFVFREAVRCNDVTMVTWV